MFSPIYLPFIKPFRSLWIIFGSAVLIRAAVHDDAILQDVFNTVIGLQFLRNYLGLPSFGIHVIIPSFCVTDIIPDLKP